MMVVRVFFSARGVRVNKEEKDLRTKRRRKQERKDENVVGLVTKPVGIECGYLVH